MAEVGCVNDAMASMVTGVVGVLGTLLAPFLAVRATSRQRAREDAAASDRRRFEERRAGYTAMVGASAQLHTLLKDAVPRISAGRYTDEDRARLEESRREHRDCCAGAQMIASERVLEASRSLNEELAKADAIAKRIDRGHPCEGETAEAARLILKRAEPELAVMRRIMREDLGVVD